MRRRGQLKRQAREIFGSARDYYQQCRSSRIDFTCTATAASGWCVVDGYDKARRWMIDNPGKAAIVTLSLLAGDAAVGRRFRRSG
jgi:hypothetical protein